MPNITPPFRTSVAHSRCSRRPLSLLIAVVVMIISISGCKQTPAGPDQSENSGPTHRIVAVSYPLQFLTQRIAGESIAVVLPVSGDADPQTWRPSREAIGKMQSADLIIANGQGATYAKWLTLVSLPDSKIRNCATKALRLKEFIAVEDVTIVHSHGPEGEHSHPTMVARTWLDPAIAKKQATYIAKQLSETYPETSNEFSDNLKKLATELDELSALLAAIPEIAGNKRIYTATPKTKFLARATGAGGPHFTWFTETAIETADKDIETALAETKNAAGVVLFETAPSPMLKKLLSSKKLQPVVVDLIDSQPAGGEFLSQLRLNIENIKQALSK